MFMRTIIPLFLVASVVLGACAGAGVNPDSAMADEQDTMMKEADDAMQDDDAIMDKEDSEEMMGDEHSEEVGSDEAMMDESDEAMMMNPAWFSSPLLDVNSGETFTIDDYHGQVVLVETMAVWCSNCLRQQREVKALHEALGDREDFTSIALDIDPNEDVDLLRGFAAKNGFDWIYVVAPADVARQFGELYGQQFLNPPSTPILLIDRDGKVHLLPFGIKSAAELQDSIVSLLDAEM